jgi:ABC-type antimicrobial peptide transport system permease subunit
MSRPSEPHQQQLSDSAKQKHEAAKKKYPFLNLSEGEYVIFSIKRHPIGLIYIWGAVASVILAVFAVVAVLASSGGLTQVGSSIGATIPITTLLIPAALISILTFVFGFIAAYIYSANEFFLTNESVIQHIQTSLFNRKEQSISLANVEDASYSQDGILPHLFGYGLLRLSTQGDETTYRFNYASQPAKQIAVLNNAVESFKNVRPISHEMNQENN